MFFDEYVGLTFNYPRTRMDIPRWSADMRYHRHLHEDEEIRYIIGGSGFFDVRGEFRDRPF